MLIGCSVYSTADSCNPEVLYKNDNSIDLFVYNDVSYVNISNVGWVSTLSLEKDELIGTIQRKGIAKNFRNWDSTVLDVGTNVYTMKDNTDILLTDNNGVMVPYLAYMEG